MQRTHTLGSRGAQGGGAHTRHGRSSRNGLVLHSTAGSSSAITVRRSSPRTWLAVQLASLLVLVARTEAQTVCFNSEYSGLCDGTFKGTQLYAAEPRTSGLRSSVAKRLRIPAQHACPQRGCPRHPCRCAPSAGASLLALRAWPPPVLRTSRRYLAYNYLSGTIPSELASLTQLTDLCVAPRHGAAGAAGRVRGRAYGWHARPQRGCPGHPCHCAPSAGASLLALGA